MIVRRTRGMVQDLVDGGLPERVKVESSAHDTNITIIRYQGPGSEIVPWFWFAWDSGCDAGAYRHGGTGTLREVFERARRLFYTRGQDPW